MNAAEIMKQIETEQMKESVSEFHVKYYNRKRVCLS